MKAYLIEEYSPDLKIEEDSITVALTPKACYDLDKKGVEYAIIEEFYSEEEFTKNENEYLKSKMMWLTKFDEFLQQHISGLRTYDLKMGTIYWIRLKSMIDPFFVRCYTLNKFVNKIRPSSITFVTRPPGRLSLNCKLFDESKRSLYAYVIPLLCQTRNIALETRYVVQDGVRQPRIKTLFRKKIRDFLSASSFVRNVHFFWKYGRKSVSKKRDNPLKILLLSEGYNGMELIATALQHGHEIYSLKDNHIEKYSIFGTKKFCDIKNIETEKKILPWTDAVQKLENDDVVRWINDICELDVSSILMPRFSYFISEICPKLFADFLFFINLYKKKRFDFVVAPHPFNPVDFAAIAAAKWNDTTKAVCIAHGDELFDVANLWKITELLPYDIHISSNNEKKEYFTAQCRLYHLHTDCYSSFHRLLPAKRICSQRAQRKQHTDIPNKITVIYPPTLFGWDRHRIDGDGIHYSDTWYYKFQKSLIEYFSTKKEYTFVWKGIPQSDGIYNPIPDFIRDKKFSNIEVATDRFVDHLLTANRVIFDFPSTGFYESVVADVPTMSIYYESFKMRTKAVEYFGKMLRRFSNISEVRKYIDEFLTSDPNLYRTTIETNDQSVIDILEEIKSGR
jgi:hypothetical protein